ncbi:MAG TPA: hypothetical protein VEE86_02505 [Thermoplasmata archaeon]|nr:hypothetical protein [Thermoplasmata archaeon]
MGRDVRWKLAAVTASVVAAALVAVVVLTAPAGWTSRTVELPASFVVGEKECYWVNSSANHDRFCLAYVPVPAGALLNGSFDHGPGTANASIYLTGGGPCTSGCPGGKTWLSPDGTGQIYWTFSQNVTLEARN